MSNVKPNAKPMDSLNKASLEQQLAELRAENAKLKEGKATTAASRGGLKVAVSGCISQYGLGQYPATYRALTKQGTWEGSQWCQLLMVGAGLTLEQTKQSPVFKFLQENLAEIKRNTEAHNATKGASKSDAL